MVRIVKFPGTVYKDSPEVVTIDDMFKCYTHQHSSCSWDDRTHVDQGAGTKEDFNLPSVGYRSGSVLDEDQSREGETVSTEPLL